MTIEGSRREEPTGRLAPSAVLADEQSTDREPRVLDILVWAHSDQEGGTEVACLVAKAFKEVASEKKVGVVTPFPWASIGFFQYEPRSPDVLFRSPLSLRLGKGPGRVDARETRRLLLNPEPGTKPDPAVIQVQSRYANQPWMSLFSAQRDVSSQVNTRNPTETTTSLCGALASYVGPGRTLVVSCGEPIALKVAHDLQLKSVIVTDHLLTVTVREVLQRAGFWDPEAAGILNCFQDYDWLADRAFLSPPEFCGSRYLSYLFAGGMHCMEIGGLFYEPFDSEPRGAEPLRVALAGLSRDIPVALLFGGSGDVWHSVYWRFQDRAGDGDLRDFALLLPAMATPAMRQPYWYLYLPGETSPSEELLDPGRLMYWYPSIDLFIGRGGLAAQQIFATMLDRAFDGVVAPEMLFVEEVGHPQIENERRGLDSLGFVHTRQLDDFAANATRAIDEVLGGRRPWTRDFVAVRYGRRNALKPLAQALLSAPF